MTTELLFTILGTCVVVAPTLLLALLGLTMLMGRPLDERWTAFATQTAVGVGLVSSVAVLSLMLVHGSRFVPIEVGNWIAIPQEDFHFNLKFVFDRLSVPFVILSFVLVGTVGAFANRYLHREPGYRRFFLFYAMFLLGMIVASLAGTIETLFVGWELVGLSSALLVAYFHDRPSPVRNGQRVWTIYRVADAAFLGAAILLHHLTGEGDFAGLMGSGPWPAGAAALTSWQALAVGSLLLVAAAGKSALVPFSGWLPRAMEGPTPSSAIFYGALSVHLGAFLLLRVSPILELSIPLSAAVVVLGLVSALYGAITASVQTDVKSALAFASLTQVGIITAEIGLAAQVGEWLQYVALVHIIGHACLRTLQLLRAPTLLHDYHRLEDDLGTHLPHESRPWGRLPDGLRRWMYRFALDRGRLDACLDEYVVRPFVNLFRWCDLLERRWTDALAGRLEPGPDTPTTATRPPSESPRSAPDVDRRELERPPDDRSLDDDHEAESADVLATAKEDGR